MPIKVEEGEVHEKAELRLKVDLWRKCTIQRSKISSFMGINSCANDRSILAVPVYKEFKLIESRCMYKVLTMPG